MPGPISQLVRHVLRGPRPDGASLGLSAFGMGQGQSSVEPLSETAASPEATVSPSARESEPTDLAALGSHDTVVDGAGQRLYPMPATPDCDGAALPPDREVPEHIRSWCA